MAYSNSLLRNLCRKKTLLVPEESITLQKSFTLLDLIFLGVGSTLGVGVYILSGHIAKDVAGPAIILSYLVAAFISILAGLCFAELGASSPSAGSVYSYCYATLGEFVAFCMGWNLLTEYIIGTASVVKTLSVYIDTYLNHTIENNLKELYEIDVPYISQYFDVLAFAICVGFAVILSFGLKESVFINNILTAVNISMVLLFIVLGLTQVDMSNWNIPSSKVPREAGTGGFLPFGWEGVITGAGLCFYGFLGFDAIATTGAEVKNPEKTLPTSIIVSLGIVFLAYFGISTVLTLVLPYYLQDVTTPLAFALQSMSYNWAGWIINVGSIFGLMASLFGAFFPISRILFSMAEDGLIFRSLAKVSPTYRTPVRGTLISGVITGLTAALLDVEHLISLNAIGTLLSYTVVAMCVIILRYSSHYNEQTSEREPLLYRSEPRGYIPNIYFHEDTIPDMRANHTVSWSIVLFSILSVLFSAMLTFDLNILYLNFFMIMTVFVMFGLILVIKSQPKRIHLLLVPFQMPMVPTLPALSIFLNIYLMMQFSLYTWIRFIFWIVIGFLIYFGYGVFNSSENKRRQRR